MVIRNGSTWRFPSVHNHDTISKTLNSRSNEPLCWQLEKENVGKFWAWLGGEKRHCNASPSEFPRRLLLQGLGPCVSEHPECYMVCLHGKYMVIAWQFHGNHMGITWEICVSSAQVLPCHRTWECAAFPGLSGAFPWRWRGSAKEVVKPNNRWWYNGTFMDKNGIFKKNISGWCL